MKKLLPLLLFLTLNLSAQTQAKIPVMTNDENLPELLQDFYQSARWAKVDYQGRISELKEVRYVKADLNFFGSVSDDGTVIFLNEELIQYKYLSRVILFRQLGKIMGLKEDVKGHNIMGSHWEIDAQHEIYAKYLRTISNNQNKIFFDALAEKNPIDKRI
jgi:hypothetical protein